jgi:UDP-N-acetylmuramoyl-tripeptide--D-alanyl-D-alanine ligase
MMTGTLALAAKTVQGTLLGADAQFRGVSTDTRSIKPGELFIALQGPNFDGTRFLEQATACQAAGAIVPRPVDDTALPTIVVDDTLRALGELAASWRSKMPATVVGITGSNGKTTLKELLAACLSIGNPTLATHGNLNNQIGVPLMLARIGEEHRYAVIEMGANHAGEIAYLTSLAAPQVVAITNAAAAHLEGFGSVEGVARAKGEILAGDEPPETVILNADDDYFEYWKSCVRDADLLTFGMGADAEIRASGIVATASGSTFTLYFPGGNTKIKLGLKGRHNVLNACAASAIAIALGIDIEQIRRGLESVRPIHGRLEAVRSASGAILYDDSYNANPVSVQAAADFLAAQPGRSWFVLGDMAELGGDAELLHAHTGWVIREAGITNLCATGPMAKLAVESFGEGGRWFDTMEELIADLRSSIGDGDVILVKGSRSTTMERVVGALSGATGTAEKN